MEILEIPDVNGGPPIQVTLLESDDDEFHAFDADGNPLDIIIKGETNAS